MGKEATPGKQTRVRILWIVGGILALALVIFAGAAISTPKKPAPPATIELSPNEQASLLATQAEVAASQDATAQARQLAEKALKLDAANATALAVIAKLDESSKAAAKPVTKPATKPGTKPGTKPVAPATDSYTTGVKDVADLLPGDIAGWKRGMVSVHEGEGVVTYEPTVQDPAFGAVVRVAVYVHDMKTASKASEFVEKVDKRLYSKNGASIKVGTLTGYTGTDGAQLAVVAFPRGRYAFEVLASGKPGATAAAMLTVAKSIAGFVPATK